MKWKNICITAILVISILLISISSVFATNEYEYNDVNVYIGGQLKTTVALRTSSVIGNNTATYFVPYIQNNILYIRMEGGVGISTGVTLDSNYFSNLYATQFGVQLNVDIQGLTYYVQFATDSYYTPINLYIDTGSTKLATPVLTFSGSTISWNAIPNATSYVIYYSEHGDVYSVLADNYLNTNFTVSNAGFYGVKAKSGSSNYSDSDISTTIQVSNINNDDSDLLDWLISNLSVITTKLGTLWNALGQFFNAIGTLLLNCLDVLPTEIKVILYSSLVVGCVLGIVKHII